MNESSQLPLPLIQHRVELNTINQRASDGYIDATAMCRAAGKQWAHYAENNASKEFARELAADLGIPISELIQSLKGGDPSTQGTWVHPHVAIHLAQWLSPKFAVAVSRWVSEWLSGESASGPAQLPYHLKRHMANLDRIPLDHFSVLQEMTIALIAPLDAAGYRLPERMLPDISQGKMFAKWLRDNHNVDTNALPTYPHLYEDGRVFPAKLYPAKYLADFRHHLANEWMPKRAASYFAEKDPKSIPYLNKVLGLAPPTPSGPAATAAPARLPSPPSRPTKK